MTQALPSLVWGGLTSRLLLPLLVGIAAGFVHGGWLGWLALAIGSAVPASIWSLTGPFPDPPPEPGQMIGFFLGAILIPATVGFLAVRGLRRRGSTP